MAMRKIGCRRIVVDGVAYLWRVPHRPDSSAWDGNTGFRVTVQSEARRGSALTIRMNERHPTVARVWGSPVVSVTPYRVASAIRRAVGLGWRPAEPGPGFAVGDEPAETEAEATANGRR